MVKKIIILIIICFSLIINGLSQVQPADEKLGAGFGAILIDLSSIDGQFGLMTGGGGGFIIKDIRIGVFFEGLVTKINLHEFNSNNTHRMQLSYGGLWVGYPLWKNKRFHALSDLKICFGTTSTQSGSNMYQRENKNFFYGFIPYLGFECYITENLSISFGVDYRFCLFPNKPENHKANLLNMPNGRIGVQLGIF